MQMNTQISNLFKAYPVGHFYQLQKEDEYRYTKLWRPKFVVGNRLNKTVTLSERFQKWDHARDEARTLARRIVRLCRKYKTSYTHIIKLANLASNEELVRYLAAIKSKHPHGVVSTVHKAIIQFEAELLGRDIRHTSSIRPIIDKDTRGYIVQGVQFVDGEDNNIFYTI